MEGRKCCDLLGDGDLAQPQSTKVCGQVRAVENSSCLKKLWMLVEPSFLSVCHIYQLMLYLFQW